MKLLIYSHSFAPQIGGVETYAMELARGMASADTTGQKGVEVTVATMAPCNAFDDSCLPFRTVRKPSLWMLLQLIKRSDFLLVAGPSLQPMLLAWLTKKPFAVEQHGYQCTCPNGLLFFEPAKSVCPGHFMARRYAKCWECNRGSGIFQNWRMWVLTFPRRWLSNRASANIAISHHVEKRLGLRNSRVIYYGIRDISSPLQSVHDEPSGVPCFGYVGRLVSEKGLGTLLRAAAVLKRAGLSFRVKFIGDGPERQTLQEQAADLGLNSEVSFTGFLNGNELCRAIESITALVMPSQCEETAGLSAMEHMMRGGIVICSDIGGLGEIVDGAGLKFPPGDSPALAAQMRMVIEQPALSAELGPRARERALHLFARKRMVSDHLELVKDIAGQGVTRAEIAPELK